MPPAVAGLKCLTFRILRCLQTTKISLFFKWALVGIYIGTAQIITSITKFTQKDKSWAFLQAKGKIPSMDHPKEEAQDHYTFMSLTGVLLSHYELSKL